MQTAAVVDQVKGTHLAQQLAQEYAAAQKNAKGSAWQAGKLSLPWSGPGAAPGRRCGPDDPGDGRAGAADPGGTCGICPTGKDIVCAAVSALVLALAERLQEKNLVREPHYAAGVCISTRRGAEIDGAAAGLRQRRLLVKWRAQAAGESHFPQAWRD